MKGDHVTMFPSAGRLMESLRDIGYTTACAVADLIDNSIDANARDIDLTIHADGPDSWLRVVDNGMGMRASELDEAMRYGSDVEYGSAALGHFGLGLKTASLSQCRRLTVASKAGPSARAVIRRWDLDHVLTSNAWEVERIPPSSAPRHLVDALPEGGGTVVLWEHLDRLLPKRPTLGMTARVLESLAVELSAHIGMVFHRFLTGEATDGRIAWRVSVNGNAIEAWDPFARTEERTQALPRQVIEYCDGDAQIAVDVQGFVLPSQHAFSSAEAHKAAGGPNRWNRHQGFYIYRRERLIQAGGWNRLRTLDEHAKLARIAVDLPSGLEEYFAVDVAKMRVSLPAEMRAEMRLIASAAVAVAQERYRDHGSDPEAEQTLSLSGNQDAISISRDWPAIMSVVEDVLGSSPELRDRLLLALCNAQPEEQSLDRMVA